MALSSSTTTVYIHRNVIRSPTRRISSNSLRLNSVSFSTKSPRFYVRSSDDESVETAETETSTEPESESAIQAPQVPPSLISALNVERALRGIPITDVDHYERLGVRRRCSYEEVPIAYQRKVEELTNQGLDEQELNEKLDLLKESYTILSTVEERRMYDWSLGRSEDPDKYIWPFEADVTQTPTQPAPPKEAEDEGPTRMVGYFLLGWFILSCVLSISLNR